MTDHFAQSPEDGEPDTEGVRIIGAEEAQEAIERGDVAPRLSDMEPRPGERPAPPAEGPRPTLRFPLSDAERAQDVARPAVVPPPEPPPSASWGDDDAGWADTEGGPWGETQWDPPAEAPPEYGAPTYDDTGYDAPIPEQAADLGDHGVAGGSTSPAEFGAADQYAEPDEYAAYGSQREPLWGDEASGAEHDETADGDPSQPVELPHWTDPPTGEVPKVIASEDDDLEAWSSFASPPRWRGDNHDWSEGDYDDMSALGDEESRVGALDPTRVGAPDSDPFAELDEPEPAMVGGVYDAYDDEQEAAPRHRPMRRPLRRHVAGMDDGGAGGGPGRDIQTAATVGIGLGIAAIILIGLAPPKIGILAVTAAAAVAAWEFFGATIQGGARAAVPVGLVAAAGLPLATYWKGAQAVPLLLVLALITALAWYVIGAGGNAPVLEGVGTTLLGVVWIGVLASFAAQFLLAHQGRSMLIGIIVVVVAADVGAFFGGQSIGRTPLSPVSPNKTREGAIVGLVAAIVMGVIIGILKVGVYRGVGAGFLLGLAIGIVAPIGDLCESVIKRDLGVKDMGNLLPGHGGLLDRIDGLLFALPAAYYLIAAFHFHY
ncbi:MAG TPA: phosphatidate cytidylyltransferase [Acidimicrobiales bacterium]|jgi:phosphatidate cytidylyltransferase|nr:phosphatidate cytidylyltransferase [Acidimicrobiales bacterium]